MVQNFKKQWRKSSLKNMVWKLSKIRKPQNTLYYKKWKKPHKKKHKNWREKCRKFKKKKKNGRKP